MDPEKLIEAATGAAIGALVKAVVEPALGARRSNPRTSGEPTLDLEAEDANSYPPYNIEQTAKNRLRITLAVAGFAMENLQITQEDNQLVIRGLQMDDSDGRFFLHHGVTVRQFQRTFVLATGIEVEGAWLDNGLLHVDLRRPQLGSMD